MFHKLKIAKCIEKLCEGPDLTFLHFENGEHITITNNVFDSQQFQKAWRTANEKQEILKAKLETIRELARVLRS